MINIEGYIYIYILQVEFLKSETNIVQESTWYLQLNICCGTEKRFALNSTSCSYLAYTFIILFISLYLSRRSKSIRANIVTNDPFAWARP